MLHSIREWLKHPWRPVMSKELLDAYNTTFSSLYGQLVLQHLLDNIYCTVYAGSDPIELATHNGRRSVISEILETLDQARDPQKYNIKIEETEDAT